MAWTVYKHISPSGKVYVGITSKDPIRRFGCKGQGYKNNKHFWSAIEKYGWDSFGHEIVETDLAHETACKLEKEIIMSEKSYDPRYGYNIALGGQGHLMTDATKEKLSKSLKKYCSSPEIKKAMSERSKKMWEDEEFHQAHIKENHPMYGHHHSQDARNRISQARTGRPTTKGQKRTAEQRQRMSEAQKGHKGTPWTEEHKRLQSERMSGKGNPNYGKPQRERIEQLRIINSKPVVQYTEQGMIRYPSAKEASRATGIVAGNISRVCNGQRLSAGGYTWSYLTDELCV